MPRSLENPGSSTAQEIHLEGYTARLNEDEDLEDQNHSQTEAFTCQSETADLEHVMATYAFTIVTKILACGSSR
jgi:hypothetical protein